MIIGGRSLVSGGRGRPARPVPRARAGRVPQRRDERAGAAAGLRGGGRVAAAPARGGPRRQGLLRGDCVERIDQLRGRVAALIGCETGELALTGSTTDGVNAVLAALDLGRGDEVLTSDEEHPGVLAPLGGAARAPRRERARGAVRRAGGRGRPAHPAGRLLARVVADRRGGGRRRPWPPRRALVLLDGAQGLGAVPVDVRRAGLRLLRRLGPEVAVRARTALGYLYVRGRAGRRAALALARLRRRSRTPRGRSSSTSTPTPAASSVGFPPPHQVDWALAALDVLEATGARRRSSARRRPGRRGSAQPARARASRRAGARRSSPGRSTTPRREVGRLAERGLRAARPAGHAARARVGRRLVERGRARPAGRAHFVAEHHDAEHDRRPRTVAARRRADQPVDDRLADAALAARARSRASPPRIARP